MVENEKTSQSIEEYLNSKKHKRDMFLLYTFLILSESGIGPWLLLCLSEKVAHFF